MAVKDEYGQNISRDSSGQYWSGHQRMDEQTYKAHESRQVAIDMVNAVQDSERRSKQLARESQKREAEREAIAHKNLIIKTDKMFEAGKTLLAQGKFEEAMYTLVKGIKLQSGENIEGDNRHNFTLKEALKERVKFVADAYYDNGDYGEAVVFYNELPFDPKFFDKYMKALSEKDMPEVYLKVARCYDEGTGTGKDENAARIWYEKAAALSDYKWRRISGDGWKSLGHYHLNGKGGFTKNKAEAKKCYKKAHKRYFTLFERIQQPFYKAFAIIKKVLGFYQIKKTIGVKNTIIIDSIFHVFIAVYVLQIVRNVLGRAPSSSEFTSIGIAFAVSLVISFIMIRWKNIYYFPIAILLTLFSVIGLLNMEMLAENPILPAVYDFITPKLESFIGSIFNVTQ